MLGKVLFLTLTTFTSGSLGQIFRVSGLNLYLYDIAILGANLYFCLYLVKKKKFYINSPLIFFIFFSVFSFVVTIFNVKNFLFFDQIYALSFWLRFNMYFLFSYFVFNLIKFDYISFSSLKNILKINFYFFLFLNLIQYFVLRDVSYMEQFGFDPHNQRLVGFFLDPNFTGFYSVIYLFLSEYVIKDRKLSFLSIGIVFLTESRSSFLLVCFLLLI